MKARIIFIAIIMLFVMIQAGHAGGTEDIQKYFNETANKVKATDDPVEKREILNKSLQTMSRALERVESSGLISQKDRAGIDQFKAALQEKQDELAGINGYARVADAQLNNFSDYVVQDMEQATLGVYHQLGIGALDPHCFDTHPVVLLSPGKHLQAIDMHSSNNLSFTSTTQPCSMLFGVVSCVALVLFLFSCSSVPLIHRQTALEKESALPPPHYSMVFIIHGDGDYLYHDTGGRAHRADEEALFGAISVAVQNPQAEVFIFHQKPKRHTLLFPRRDGKFYHYRNGRLLAKESYWRDHGSSRFDPEAELYHRFHLGEQSQLVKLFFYFGHEIPEFDRTGYDASYPKKTFEVHELADGLKRMTRDSTKFDLLVLSTCFGGTPHTIAALAPYTRTIVASPGNLHLSYFYLCPFKRLDVGLRDGDVPRFAKNYARQAFELLTEDIQTAVTVAVYDVDRVQEYVQSIDSVYDQTLTTLKGRNPVSVERCDCAEGPATMQPGMSEGVDVFYRPPRFGRSKHKRNHSGWECYKLK
ncbi:MAG: hypothetical protein U5R06_01635 [candidate division KSB1 bacterium]|nr:hypothetical protein [candidate division KSB1 bacterium]